MKHKAEYPRGGYSAFMLSCIFHGFVLYLSQKFCKLRHICPRRVVYIVERSSTVKGIEQRMDPRDERRSTMILHDFEIVALYHARDEQAIEISQKQYGNYCHTISMNILHSPPDAEECVNDTWVAAWNSMPPKRPANLCAYLGKLVRNISLNRLKALHREKRDATLTVAFEELEDIISAPDETDSAMICGWLDEYLGTLPQLDRQLFVGRYWYGHSVKALARHYGMTANAATKRITRTREGLRNFLKERGYTP